MLEAGNAAYTEIKNICVWSKANAGMGSFYRSQHEFVCVFKSGNAPHINNIELGNMAATGRIFGPTQVSTASAMVAPISNFIQRSNLSPSLRMRCGTVRVAKASC